MTGARLQETAAPSAAAPAPGPSAPGPAAPAADAASPVTLQASADRTSITVGDPVTITYTVRHPPGYTLVSFDPGRNLEALTLLDAKEGSPRTLENGQIEETRVLTLAAYATGAKEIPSISVVYRDPTGTEGHVEGKVIALDVTSVLLTGQKDPADIKPVVSMPEKAIWPWLLLGALIVAAAVAYYWWGRRRKTPEAAAAAPAAPPRPAHEIAYADLERLLSSGLLEKGAVKEFYIELAEIGRRYLGARFGIDTFERTTGELMEALRLARVSVAITGKAGEFLTACDLVKFARHRPEPEETRRTVEACYRLVDETKIMEPLPGTAPPLSAALGARS